ncbi:hypothetical protein STENM327S_05764 [Streptomyces tendae]
MRTRAQRAGRAYIWLNLVEQRLRAVVAAVLRPVYEPVHGDDWVVAAAGPAGQEWVQRAVAVREVSRRKGDPLDPADDNVLSFLTLPQLRELMVQHWPCFEPYADAAPGRSNSPWTSWRSPATSSPATGPCRRRS